MPQKFKLNPPLNPMVDRKSIIMKASELGFGKKEEYAVGDRVVHFSTADSPLMINKSHLNQNDLYVLSHGAISGSHTISHDNKKNYSIKIDDYPNVTSTITYLKPE